MLDLRPKTMGISTILFPRILVFVWSFGAPTREQEGLPFQALNTNLAPRLTYRAFIEEAGATLIRTSPQTLAVRTLNLSLPGSSDGTVCKA